MQGKGWFVIYAVLLFGISYLFFAHLKTVADIKTIKGDIAALQEENRAAPASSVQPTTKPTPQPTATPNVATPQGRDAKRKADLAAMASALNAYRKDKGSYPTGLRDLQPTYIEALPNDPIQLKYTYRYTRTSTGYVLTSVLEVKGDPDDAVGDGKSDGVYTVTGKV